MFTTMKAYSADFVNDIDRLCVDM